MAGSVAAEVRQKGIMKRIKCPCCRKVAKQLIEIWVNHTIYFDTDANGMWDGGEGFTSMGNPAYVDALCECGHRWRLRGVKQIDDVKAA